MPKNMAPNSGTPSGVLQGREAFVKKIDPFAQVQTGEEQPAQRRQKQIQRTVLFRSLRCAAITAITMVRLLASSTTVIVVELNDRRDKWETAAANPDS